MTEQGFGCGSDAEIVHRVKTQILRAVKRQAVPEGTESVILMVVDSLLPVSLPLLFTAC